MLHALDQGAIEDVMDVTSDGSWRNQDASDRSWRNQDASDGSWRNQDASYGSETKQQIGEQ